MKKLIVSLIFILFTASGFSQGSLRQRLVSQVRYGNDRTKPCCEMFMFDSLAFRYSGSRHSDFDFNTLAYLYPYNNPVSGGISAIIHPNNIDAIQNSLPVQFDTMRRFRTDGVSGDIIYGGTETVSYDPNGMPYESRAFSEFDTVGGAMTQYRYANGNLIYAARSYLHNINPGVFDGRYLFRDALGQVIIDSTVRSTPRDTNCLWLHHYQYDAAGRYTAHYTGQAGSSQYATTFTYDANGRVSRLDYNHVDTGGNLIVQESHIITYTPGVPGYTSRLGYVGKDSTRKITYQYSSHVNAQGLKDTIYESYFNSPYLFQTIVEYNAYGNPSIVTYNGIDSGSRKPRG